MNPVVENTVESISDKRLDQLMKKEGQVYLFDGSRNVGRFVSEVVTDLASNSQWTNVVFQFKASVSQKIAKGIVKRINRTIKEYNAYHEKRGNAKISVVIDAVYGVPTDLFAKLEKEISYTDDERALIVQSFVDALTTLQKCVPVKINFEGYLSDILLSWDQEDIKAALKLDSRYHAFENCDIPVMMLLDATAILKRHYSNLQVGQ